MPAAKAAHLGFYAKLTGEQLKELCRASKQKMSGSKQDLIDRLTQGDSTRAYNAEYRAGTLSR